MKVAVASQRRRRHGDRVFSSLTLIFGIAIVAITRENKIVLVEQYRTPLGKRGQTRLSLAPIDVPVMRPQNWA